MTNAELETKLADIDAQLRKLFSLCGQNWQQIQKQARDNRPQAPAPFSPNQAFGELHRPKDHERQ